MSEKAIPADVSRIFDGINSMVAEKKDGDATRDENQQDER